MLSEYNFQRLIILGQCLLLDEEPVREMTIGNPPQCEEKTRETLICLKILIPMTQHFKYLYLIF